MLKYLLGSASVLALAPVAAMAQQAPTRVADPVATSSEQQQVGIGDIIVTASRRAENVQRTALSIQAISGDDLVRANVVKPEDIAAIAPGVQIGTAGAYAQVYVRGVGNFATSAFAEGPVAINLDGVYISRAWAVRGMFYDLDRIEVLKGPQGTLYGRNASGGAINVITTKPRLGEFGGFGEIQVGNYNLIQGTAAINLPLGDTLAVRVSGQVVSRDGYLSDGYDDDKTQSARLQLKWEPSSDVSLLLSGQYQHIGGKGAGSALMPQLPGDKWRSSTDPAVVAIIRAEPFLGPLLAVPQTNGFFDIDVYSVSAELNWNLGFATLTVLPSYRYAEQRVLQFTSAQSVAPNEKNDQTSLEVRLSGENDKFKWVVGGYYFDEKAANISGKSGLVVGLGFFTQDFRNIDANSLSYATFGQATYSLTDQFRVTAGLRYTYEKKTNQLLIINYQLPDFGSGACGVPPFGIPGSFFDPTTPYPPGFCRFDVTTDQRVTYNNVSWKAGVEYDVGPQSMAYANVSTGFKSGGFYPAPPPNTFRPEKLTSFEAGMKNRFFDNRLQVNIEGFYWKYKDHQESFAGPTSIPAMFTLVTKNAGKATLYGADLDVVFRPTLRDELSFKVQYNKTKYDSFTFDWLTAAFGPPVTGCATSPGAAPGFTTIDCSGKSLIRAPLWSGNVGYNHTFDLGEHGSINASFDVEFASGTDLSIDFRPSDRQDAFAIGNFDLSYTTSDKKIAVSAFVRNIWNEAVYNQTFRYSSVSPSPTNPLAGPDGLFLGTLRPPRTFGGRLRVNF